MKKAWSANWKTSENASKQRKYIANAPLHIKSKQISAHLSKELKKKYGTRNTRARKGDKILVVRGDFRGKRGAIDSVDMRNSKVYVVGIERLKKDGSKARVPLVASKLIITELNLADKKRMQKFSNASKPKSELKPKPEMKPELHSTESHSKEAAKQSRQ